MNKLSEKHSVFNNIFAGFTGAALTGSYALCFCTAAGLGLIDAFFCTALCAFFSLALKNKIFSPDAFLLVPTLFVATNADVSLMPLTVITAALVFLILQKFIARERIPDCVFAGVGLGLALAATVLLTNIYFGIGADGATPLEMLRSYRSHGFHPHFHGLLYGTITLFAMITYPFKFKKLNKYIPAEFITLFVPFILNLFLNPDKELTAINEADFLSRAPFSSAFITGFSDFEVFDIVTALTAGAVLGFFMLFYKRSDKRETHGLVAADVTCGAVCGIPVRTFEINTFSPVSAVTMFAVSVVCVLFLPEYFDRIPAHSMGALLIVSAWQQTPFAEIAKVFKKKGIINIICTVAIAAAFVFCDIFTAVTISAAFAVILRKPRGSK